MGELSNAVERDGQMLSVVVPVNVNPSPSRDCCLRESIGWKVNGLANVYRSRLVEVDGCCRGCVSRSQFTHRINRISAICSPLLISPNRRLGPIHLSAIRISNRSWRLQRPIERLRGRMNGAASTTRGLPSTKGGRSFSRNHLEPENDK
jgi:hypothetical protein